MKLVVKDGKATLHSRATPAVMALIPRIEGRRTWQRPIGLVVEATQHNIRVLRELPEVELINEGEPKVRANVTHAPYRSKTEPFPHQVKIRQKIADHNTFAIFAEQGTGKTKVCIDWLGELFAAGQLTGVIVVSKKGVHRQWIESEIPDHCGAPWVGTWWPKPLHDREKTKLEFFTVNYDALRGAKIAPVFKEFLTRHEGRLAIIADESQEIKNPQSQRFKKMVELKPHSDFRQILTGTPIAKDLTDEWAQLKWLDEKIIGIKYLTTFRSEFCVMGGFENRAVVGHKNVDRFKALVEPKSIRVTKSDIGILPKQYNRWKFDLTKEQRDIIRDLKSDLESELASGEIVTVANAAVLLSKIQQVASGFLIGENEQINWLMPFDKNPRILATIEWRESIDGRKALYWARFRADMIALVEAHKIMGRSFVQYHGGVNDKDRDKAKTSWMSPDGADGFIGNPQSAGTGLNLQGLCSNILYYTNSFAYIDRSQSEDRTHRIGSNGIITYTDLIASGSTDGYIVSNLRRKRGLSQMVLGDIREMIGEM